MYVYFLHKDNPTVQTADNRIETYIQLLQDSAQENKVFCSVYNAVMGKVREKVGAALLNDAAKQQWFYFVTPVLECTSSGDISVAPNIAENNTSISWCLLICHRELNQLWYIDPLCREIPSDLFHVMTSVWKLFAEPLQDANSGEMFAIPKPNMLHKCNDNFPVAQTRDVCNLTTMAFCTIAAAPGGLLEKYLAGIVLFTVRSKSVKSFIQL